MIKSELFERAYDLSQGQDRWDPLVQRRVEELYAQDKENQGAREWGDLFESLHWRKGMTEDGELDMLDE